MIAKGNLHDGNRLAAYLVTGKTGERAELAVMEGFAASDLRDAFRDVEIQARATKARFPFFHLYTRFPRGEIVDDEKGRALCLEIVRREIAALGFTGQPYAVAFQIDRATGELHVHAGISRIARRAGGRLFAIDPGLYKNRLKEISRACERDYGLTIVNSDRQPGDRARASRRNEFEEARRLGTNVRAIRNAILDCFETSDSGRALKAALNARGFELATGDRRDCFVVIDQAGGHHALTKKLTGMTLAQIRQRLCDLDRAQLPGVDQAKIRPRARLAQDEDPARDFSRAAATAAKPAQKATETRKHGRAADVPEPATPAPTAPQIRAPPLFCRLARSLTSRTRSLWRGATAAITRGLAQASELPRRPVAGVGRGSTGARVNGSQYG
ncbi:MAG TPA: relaxase/mobilization nuclease domain-containing protein [Xanthobacteraceae bacterium]|nr:relaxase/mobilization nuclease domain-containing protein [Xanthobacteraceae bacterium]